MTASDERGKMLRLTRQLPVSHVRHRHWSLHDFDTPKNLSSLAFVLESNLVCETLRKQITILCETLVAVSVC